MLRQVVFVFMFIVCFFVLAAGTVSCGDFSSRVENLYKRFEQECLEKGWQRVDLRVNDLTRKILWKGPGGSWTNGAIITLHGGGGTYSNYCANIRIGRPMVEFSEMAISEGFAVFSLESEEGFLRDQRGDSCGKRWLSMAIDNGANPDTVFIEKVIREIIPGLRPANSSKSIFMTGHSNGAFMTVLAATHLSDKIEAFAPVSGGDPYGIYVDCSEGSAFRHTPGKFYDRETKKPINEKDACKSEKYTNEKSWPGKDSLNKPPFKLFYHLGDSVDDTSCKEKLKELLVRNGYSDAGSVILGDVDSTRWPLNHFWMDEYNRPLIDFFKKYARKPE
ncbi:MAG: hypothetical protein SCH71_08050 [Desulfobulbaceae bacterium]|nr:hypothetical protein [Desulfobulbaceae bacterium]